MYMTKNGKLISSKEALTELAKKQVTIDEKTLGVIGKQLVSRISEIDNNALIARGVTLTSFWEDAKRFVTPFGEKKFKEKYDTTPEEFSKETFSDDFEKQREHNLFITRYIHQDWVQAELLKKFIDAEQTNVGNGFNAIVEALKEIAPSADLRQIRHLAGILNIEYQNTLPWKEVENIRTANTLKDKPITMAEMQHDEETGVRTN